MTTHPHDCNQMLDSPMYYTPQAVQSLKDQRITRGWSDVDTWNLGEYVMRVTGEMLVYFADHTDSYLDTYATPEHWQAELRERGQDILAYVNSEDDAQIMRAQAAMTWVAENANILWD